MNGTGITAAEAVAATRTRLVVLLGLLGLGLPPSTAAAARHRLSYRGTAGSDSYAGHSVDVSAGLARGFFAGIGLSTYRSDISNGTFKTYSGRVGRRYAGGFWRLSGSVTPEVAGFRSRSIGFDVSQRIMGGDRTAGQIRKPARVYVNLGISRIMTRDGERSTDADEGGGSGHGMMSAGRMRGSGDDSGMSPMINQTDLTGGVSASIRRTYLSGAFTKSLYDRHRAGGMMGEGRRTEVQGISPLLEGYPDRSISLRVSRDVLPWLWGWGSYGNIVFKSGTPSANSYAAGAGVSWRLFEATVEYSRYIPGGRAARNYISLGGSVRFGK